MRAELSSAAAPDASARCPRRRTRRRFGASRAGSGTAIGTAVMFPMLMLVIVIIEAVVPVAGTEMLMSTAANRAARSASLCCLHVDEATEAAKDSLRLLQDGVGNQQAHCVNDLADDASVVFLTVERTPVAAAPDDPNPRVPPGGQVAVTVSCRVAASNVGTFWVGVADLTRLVVATASIDPYRHRPE